MAQVLFCEAVTGEEPNPPPNKALVIIDTDAPSVKYDRRIFGGFLEHFDDQIYGGIFDPGSPLADEKGFRRDVLAALKELGTPIVRWPGGCFVSGYHWEFGVGKQRKPVDDMAWGVIESNAFGTDEYMELCRLLDWEPFICTNAGNGTIQEMLNWLEYCNGTTGDYARLRKANGFTEPHNVMIWSIGNENYHPTEIGHKPIEQWAPFVRQAAEAMKAADPDIKLTAAAQATRQWTLPLLEMGGPYLDYISIHSYWLHLWHRNDAPDYLTCIMHSEGPEQTLANCISILDESGYRGKIKIAYDEWNLRGWYHPKFPRTTVQDYSDPEVQRLVKARKLNNIPSQYTMADALFSASFFNACLRHADDVAMANIAPIVNTRGPLFVHPEGIVKRTHFHTMAMYAGQLQPRVGRLSLTADKLTHGDKSVPVADAIATVDESGKQWAIALVNRHPNKPLSCTVKFGERTLEGMFDALVLAGDSPDAYNDIQHPNRVVPRPKQLMFRQNVVSLPPHSLTIIKIDTFAQARQPILPDFHADPSARVFDGKLYIYPSHDAPGARNWKDMVDWHVFSTDDMVTWTDHGVIFSLEDISWADTEAWAPDCIERNGKYYFYFTAGSRIGVAVSDSPAGPFRDALGEPLVKRGEAGIRWMIDPCVFMDDDGQAYLYVGGAYKLAVVKLKEDMITRDGPLKVLEMPMYYEGIWIHKRKGIYYASYPIRPPGHQANVMAYSMAKSPLGPFEYKGEIIDNRSLNVHGSIIKFKDQCYLFYHVAGPSNWERRVCVEPLFYNEDGTIKPIQMSKDDLG